MSKKHNSIYIGLKYFSWGLIALGVALGFIVAQMWIDIAAQSGSAIAPAIAMACGMAMGSLLAAGLLMYIGLRIYSHVTASTTPAVSPITVVGHGKVTIAPPRIGDQVPTAGKPHFKRAADIPEEQLPLKLEEGASDTLMPS